VSVLLAKPWDAEKHDPSGWWMSEKLDGVRAIWFPDRMTGDSPGQFLSRNMKVFYAPEWFKKLMPNHRLDGELFVGRGAFQDTVSVVRSHEDKGWKNVAFHAFDFYPTDVQLTEFEDRIDALRDVVALAKTKHLTFVEQVECKGHAHLTAFVDRIVGLGGEGAMLRKPRSLYEKKRSSTLLKVKRFFDLEAEVVGHVPGKGKHLGRLGALDCVIAGTKVSFQVGTGFSDAEREAPPKVGARVTVRYQEKTRDGIPRFPVYVVDRDYE
jgi:DNA ligase-1